MPFSLSAVIQSDGIKIKTWKIKTWNTDSLPFFIKKSTVHFHNIQRVILSWDSEYIVEELEVIKRKLLKILDMVVILLVMA